jgi:hypothetical protein
MSASFAVATRLQRVKDLVTSEPVLADSSEELCNELMMHTFECEQCISGREEACPQFRSLQGRIQKAGGPARGVMLCM